MSLSASTQLRQCARAKFRESLLELAHQLSHLAHQPDEQRVVELGDEESLSPIHRVPEDVLHHIFDVCLSDNDLTIDDPNHPTVVLSHVCHPWRDLVLSYSPSWSNIRIVTPPSPICQKSYEEVEMEDPTDHHREEDAWKVKMQRLIEAARTFIARSNECPLTITFCKEDCEFGLGEPGAYEVYRNTHSSLVQLLCSASKRWSKCCLELRHCDCIHGALEIIIKLTLDDVPILDSLIWRADDLYPFRNAGDIFLSPSLKKLHLLFTLNNRPWSSLSANWASLTELYYEGFIDREYNATERRFQHRCFGPRSALALLKRCPSLVTCSLLVSTQAFGSLAYRDFPDENLDSPVELFHLRNLTIKGYIPALELRDLLRLPSLQELHLLECDTRLEGDMTTPECIFPWIEKYGDVIVSLSVVLKNLSIEDTLKLLTRVPGVRSLKIRVHRGLYDAKALADAILEALTPQLDDNGGLTKTCLCPGLRKVGFSQDTDAFREMDMVPFIKARRSHMLGRHGVSTVEDVKMGFARREGVDIRALLLVEGVNMEGLSLEVQYEGFWWEDEDVADNVDAGDDLQQA